MAKFSGNGWNGVPQREIAVIPPKVVAPPPDFALVVHTVFLVS